MWVEVGPQRRILESIGKISANHLYRKAQKVEFDWLVNRGDSDL
jgi:hypothetical protein